MQPLMKNVFFKHLCGVELKIKKSEKFCKSNKGWYISVFAVHVIKYNTPVTLVCATL
jgi:hypothetical protein